jgi:hypothetical protein
LPPSPPRKSVTHSSLAQPNIFAIKTSRVTIPNVRLTAAKNIFPKQGCIPTCNCARTRFTWRCSYLYKGDWLT